MADPTNTPGVTPMPQVYPQNPAGGVPADGATAAGAVPAPQAYQQAPYAQPAYQQPVYQQPVYVQPAAAAPAQAAPAASPPKEDDPRPEMSIVLVSHSMLFYWWPIWVAGFAMALVTSMGGTTFNVNGHPIRVYGSSNLGILFLLTAFLVILITNVTVRGLASTIVILSLVLATVLFAYFGWWDSIFAFVGGLNVYINEGAYFWFSTLMFLVWAGAVFIFDRFSYWRVTPGQMTHIHVFGASSKSYDTQNMSFEKRRDDVFRHWILGMGSGDLVIHAFNAGQRTEILVPNVLFVGRKVAVVERLISMEPTENDQAPAPAAPTPATA